MTAAVWFDELAVVHRLRGRVRLRYRCHRHASTRRAAIEGAVRALDGVSGANANPSACSLVVRFDESRVGVDALVRAIAELPPVGARGDAPEGGSGHSAELVLSAANLLTGAGQPLPVRSALTLGSAVPLFRRAAGGFAERGIDSHVLEALAVFISLNRNDHIAANTTVFMLALGEYLEDSIARRSDELLKHLLRPRSDRVWVRRDGIEVEIPASELAVGDNVIVGTGAVVPVDGTVLGGTATINEASMTGESVPVTRQRGDSALAGTLVVEGRLVVYAERVGSATAAARIADYVAASLTMKSTAQLEASRLADRLVPKVLGLAAATRVTTGSWTRAASVLQADYSCALKLATPVAFKSAMYGAGQDGILFKGATALERFAEADTIVFDKTGTLTAGKLIVTDAITFDGSYTADDLVCLAASVEEHYFHPMALAVVAAAQATSGRQHFDHQEVEFVVAHGVASVVDGKRIVVGSRHFIEEDEGIPIGRRRALVERLRREGKTVLYIGFGGRLLGVLALKDEVRSQSARTIRRLRTLGVKTILMLSGDHRERANELARDLGLDGCHAELMPSDKARIVESLIRQGHKIAFVGDGINDAPALAGAHVGIAMHKGADIARLTADVALLEDDIERVADAKALANASMARVATNYRLTVGLNTAILAAAAFGWLSPVMTAVLHNGSTVGILLNALRGHGNGHRRRPRRPEAQRATR